MDNSGRGRGPAYGRAARWSRPWLSFRASCGPSRLACPVAAALVLWAVAGVMPAPPATPPATPSTARVQLVDHPGARPAHAKRGRSAHARRGRPAHRGTAVRHRPASGDRAAVGALFSPGLGGEHFCTGTVVHSPAHDLMVTAAHCADPGGHPRRFVFVPGYRDGRAPYGAWRPRQVVVGTGWTGPADPADDVAFVVMYPSHGKNIGDVVAGEDIGRTAAFSGPVKVTGYPDDAQRPVACTNTISYSVHGPEFDCPGFTAGTSGGPWLASLGQSPGPGSVIGVIGGYEEGGVSPAVSYSPVFGPDIIGLYQQAVAAGRELAASR